MSKPIGPKFTFAKALLRQFSKLDRDDSGFITKSEVEESLGDDCLVGEEAACAGTLYSKSTYYRQLSRLSNDQFGPDRGVSTKDVEKLSESPIIPMEKRFQENLAKSQQVPAKLYTGNSPTASGVRQGSVGNCWLLAPLASLASQRPDELKKRISALPSGQFQVRLPRGQTEVVDAPTRVEQLVFANGLSGEIWANIYEKGVAQHRAFFSKEADTRQCLNWGFAGSGFKLVTGAGHDTDWLPLTKDSALREKVGQAHDEKRVMTLATGQHPIRSITLRDTEVEGIIPGHCYSVLGYESESDELIIRNPWGIQGWTGDPNGKDGTFRMPLEEVRNHFSTISYECS